MSFESVHNYYEHLVYEEILQNLSHYGLDRNPGLLEDIACVALNKLPPKYIRYDIDLAFYLSGEERSHMETSVREAVKSAVAYVISRHAEDKRTNPD